MAVHSAQSPLTFGAFYKRILWVEIPGAASDGLRVEEAFFRGRKLQGTTIPLPDGFSGIPIRFHVLRL